MIDLITLGLIEIFVIVCYKIAIVDAEHESLSGFTAIYVVVQLLLVVSFMSLMISFIYD